MPQQDVTIRFLEMRSPEWLLPRLSERNGVMFGCTPKPMPELNRFFYTALGGRWVWYERRPWSRERWIEYLSQPGVETWVLSVDGVPAGYSELQKHENGDVELMYFGLLEAFIGSGLGAHLLTCAVQRAWAMGASRVILNTCNLDHEAALPNYLARGFREYRVEVQRKEVPDHPLGPWDGA